MTGKKSLRSFTEPCENSLLVDENPFNGAVRADGFGQTISGLLLGFSSAPAFQGDAEQPLKPVAFEVVGCRALRRMAKSVAHGNELPDCPVQLIRLCDKLPSIYFRTIGRKHGGNLFKRETGISP